MTTIEIANKLVELCRQGKDREAHALYASNAVSVEPFALLGMDREARGLSAIQAKTEWWYANHDVHSVSVSGPWPHDNRFIVGFQIEVTNKSSGKRMNFDEVGLYTIENGKIASRRLG